ncbi:4a-hydroxytetrahydrobiopterin dehydratase [filamentous cyanobacterium CCP3]|nr:4a-hydroxytetrahydrobiopterin dehydratase [filamentous cyanobacterium CCP3]
MGLSAKRSPVGGGPPQRCRFGLRVAALASSLLVGHGALPAATPPNVPSGWSRVGDSLITVCQFADFAAAVAFVQRLVEPSDRLGHHPGVAIAYNRLTLSLTTHDAGGITSLDFALAREIAALHDGQCQPPSPPSAR